MKNKNWFKEKSGLVWYPVSWEGVITSVIYVTVIILSFMWTDGRSHSVSDTLISFAPIFIIITGLFLIICYKKS
jgi:hypothetical protein